MSRRHQLMRAPGSLARFAACCAVALAGCGLAGCGAGQVTQTDSQIGALDGAIADVGDIALRDVLVPYPEDQHGNYAIGSDVPLQLTIVNQGNTADVLESVSTPVAQDVLVQGTSTIPPKRAVVSPPESAASTQHESAGSTRPEGTGQNVLPPPHDTLDFDEIRIVLVDITQPLRPGLNTKITFVFRDAGPVTLPVPMGLPTESERQPLEDAEHAST